MLLRTVKFFALGYLIGEIGFFRTLKTLVIGAVILTMAVLYVTKDAAIDLAGTDTQRQADGHYKPARDTNKDFADVLDGR